MKVEKISKDLNNFLTVKKQDSTVIKVKRLLKSKKFTEKDDKKGTKFDIVV